MPSNGIIMPFEGILTTLKIVDEKTRGRGERRRGRSQGSSSKPLSISFARFSVLCSNPHGTMAKRNQCEGKGGKPHPVAVVTYLNEKTTLEHTKLMLYQHAETWRRL
ncbi:hypothetical protein CEXT_151021 [Caerostris extrusa]|uniref:Uncharacterized protein n=1 Tax=Caerostris extrusa TaxID=172846 RepID=A0AAV4UZG3_CAEEX|nr:hypothetical protein CEXT_151021 [Caerostris extrusa]